MRFNSFQQRAQRAYRYADHGDSVSCTLALRLPTGQLMPLRRATVSKAALARAIAKGGVELGWFGSSWVRKGKEKVTSTAKKAARAVVDKVIKPVGKTWVKVERAVRPIGKKIPVVGYFAKLHEDYVAPYTQALFTEKERAKKAARSGSPKTKAVARKRLIAAAAAEARAKHKVLQATAKLARTEPKVLARKAKNARKRADVYKVVTPSGKVFRFPASQL